MKKFQFKLETVLKVKEKKEEQLKRELMKLQAMKIEQEQILKLIEQEKNGAMKDKAREKGAGTDIMSIVLFEKYLNSLRLQISITEKNIKELENLSDEKRTEVVEASREKKIFEKLKEKHRDIFNKIVENNEQKQLDEIAVSKYNRKEQHNY